MHYLRRNVIDIEVNSPKEFPKPEEAKYPITAITLWDSYTDRYYTLSYHPSAQIEKKTIGNWDIYHFNDKKQLIIKFIKLIQILDPDTYEGFFSRTFDFPYIHNYLKSLGINQNVLSSLGYATIKGVKYIISGRHTLDIKDADMKFKLRSSYSLKNIAADEKLPVQKIDVDFRTVNDNLELLDQYNKTDVEVTVKMDEKLQHIKRYVSRWQFAGLEDIDRAMSNSVVVDTVMVREAKKLGVVLPSKPEYVAKDKEDDEDDITGGLVFTPIIGIHDWIDVFDQSRFYPNLGLLLCMSPENISDNGTLVSANRTRFINNPNAFLPRIISQFFKERDKVQAEKAKLTPDHPNYWKLHEEDENIKFLVNSIPGVFGHRGFRLYDPRIIDSITTSGQALMVKAKEYNEKNGFIVTYGDTDACHTKVTANNIEEALLIGKEITTNLNKMFPVWANELFNVTDATSIKIVFEKIYRRIIYVPKENGKPAKKRYAARLVYEKGKPTDQIYIRGFDYRRSNTAKITKDIQYEVFKKILYADNIESIRADVVSYVKDMINKFSTFDLSYIGIPSGFSKPLSLYGGVNKAGHKQGIDPEVRGAIYSNQHLHTNFDAGSKVKLIYVKRILDTELPQTDAICFDDEKRLPLLEVDYEKMINATIRKKIERVLLTCGIPWSEIEGQKSLFNF